MNGGPGGDGLSAALGMMDFSRPGGRFEAGGQQGRVRGLRALSRCSVGLRLGIRETGGGVTGRGDSQGRGGTRRRWSQALQERHLHGTEEPTPESPKCRTLLSWTLFKL